MADEDPVKSSSSEEKQEQNAPQENVKKISVTVKTPKEKEVVEVAENASVKEVRTNITSFCNHYLFPNFGIFIYNLFYSSKI